MKKDKLLQKVINNPKNVRFNEFETLVCSFGFKYSHTTGSHQIYASNKFDTTINIQPDKNGKAKTYQIKGFLKILEENNAI